jgi:cell division septation protein DedD
MNSPSLLLLGALVAPVMAPAIGLSLGTVVGSARFFFRSFLGVIIGGFLVVVAGALAGFGMQLWLPETLIFAPKFAQLAWDNFIVLVTGMVLTATFMVNSDRKPLIPSLAVAYQLYLPLALAGIGLTSGFPNLWPDGVVVFAIYLAWAALLGAFTLALLGFRPLSLFGYTLGGAVALIGVILVIGISGTGAAIGGQMGLPTPIPTRTATSTPVPPTSTLTLTPVPPTLTSTPTLTPTLTQTATTTPSPTPTPVYAYINALSGNPPGAKIRSEPEGTVIRSYLNNTLVQVLPDSVEMNGLVWVHVIVVEDGTEGWILQSLLLIATPPPNW